MAGKRLATAEVCEPTTGGFTVTAGALATARDFHAATRLADGRVLVTGGNDGTGTTTASAEIYNPATGTFSAAGTGSMTTGRNQHTMTLLQSGKVLIAGGFTSGSNQKSAEIFDPATATFSSTAGSMTFRGRHTATLLTDGKVLIAGGQANNTVPPTAELYDPTTDSFSATTGAMTTGRREHAATLLPDGSVIISGGHDTVAFGQGSNYVPPVASAERFLPASSTFVPAWTLEACRSSQTSTRLPNGTVFVAGGASQSWMSNNSAELYDVAAAPALTTASLPDGQIGVAYGPLTLAATGGAGGPYHIALVAGVLPNAMVFDSSTFVLSGTPHAGGQFPLSFRITDSASQSVDPGGHASCRTGQHHHQPVSSDRRASGARHPCNSPRAARRRSRGRWHPGRSRRAAVLSPTGALFGAATDSECQLCRAGGRRSARPRSRC